MLTGFLLGIGATVGVIAVCAFIETMSRNHEGRLRGPVKMSAMGTLMPDIPEPKVGPAGGSGASDANWEPS